MNKQDIIEKAKISGLSFNETELAYIVAALEYNWYALSPSMDYSLVEARGNTYMNMKTDRHETVRKFIEWIWEGMPCPMCHATGWIDDPENFCEHCEGAGRLSPHWFTEWYW